MTPRTPADDFRVLATGARGGPELEERLGSTGLDWASVPLDALAVGRWAGEDPRPAVILVRGGPDGELAGHVRTAVAACPDLPVVAASEIFDESLRSAVLDAGAVAYLAMDEAPVPLRVALSAALDRHRLQTEMRHLRRRLEDAHRRFRNTVERIADGIAVIDEEGTIRFVNPAAETLFGRPGSELVGQPFGFPVVVGDTAEVDLVGPDGSPTVADLRITETTWDDRPARLVSLRDITARKEAEEQARRLIREQTAREEAEQQADRDRFLSRAARELSRSLEPNEIVDTLLELVVSRLGDICVIDVVRDSTSRQSRRLVSAREGFDGRDALERLGRQGGRLLVSGPVEHALDRGASVVERSVDAAWIHDHVADESDAAVLRELAPATLVVVPLVAGESSLGALTLLCAEGGRALEDTDPGLLEELARRAGRAVENARLFRLAQQGSQAKTDFLNVISHELRTPLTAIVGYTGLMKEKVAGELTETQDDYLDGIDRNSRQLLSIIDQILLFADTEANREEVEYQLESLHDLVDDVVAVARPMAEREGLSFEANVPPGDAEVAVDHGKVRQILLHLLGNAVKFTDEGTIHLDVTLAGEALVFVVRDSGIGIPDTEMDRIFEAFTQVERPSTREFGGTGIGLNVVRNLVQLLNGTVEVESEVDRGSRFTVRLPLPDPPSGS